jgi:hypothetical protein
MSGQCNAMKITATDDVPDDALQEFRSSFESDVLAPEGGRFFFKSLDAPSWVHVIASLEWWQQALSAAAALYIAEIVKEAAKETWKSRAKILSSAVKSCVEIKNFAGRVAHFKTRLAARTEVVIGLPQPRDYDGTHLTLTAEDPGVVEIELALFVHYLPAVALFLAGQKTKGTSAATGYFLEIRPNADLLIWWFDNESCKRNEVLISVAPNKV